MCLILVLLPILLGILDADTSRKKDSHTSVPILSSRHIRRCNSQTFLHSAAHRLWNLSRCLRACRRCRRCVTRTILHSDACFVLHEKGGVVFLGSQVSTQGPAVQFACDERKREKNDDSCSIVVKRAGDETEKTTIKSEDLEDARCRTTRRG